MGIGTNELHRTVLPGTSVNREEKPECSPDGGIQEGRCRGYRGWGSRGREQAVQELIQGNGVIKDSVKIPFESTGPGSPFQGGKSHIWEGF